jgi:hypothetical protein
MNGGVTNERKKSGQILAGTLVFSSMVVFLLSSVWTIAYGIEHPFSTADSYNYLPAIFHESDFQGPNPKGQLNYEDLVMSALESGAVDNWTLTIDSQEFLTITVAPASSANILISVLAENGQIVVDRQDQAPIGEVETISNLSLGKPGSYQIHISSEPAEESDYALMVMNAESFNFDFRGTLSSGEQSTDSLSADSDHFWFFSASDGEIISMQVTPNDQGDVYTELYGPDGSRLLTIDNNLSGEAEKLDNYGIPDTGMYGVLVGEYDFAAMSYQIIVSKS